MDDNPEQAFTNIFKSGSAQVLITDGSEVIIDSLIKDGILKDFPIVGSAINIVKLGKWISDFSFHRKLLNFFSKTEEIPEDDRKALIIGNLIISKAEKMLSMEDFLRFAHLLPRVFYFDLIKLPEYINMKTTQDPRYDKRVAASLEDAGLLRHGVYTGDLGGNGMYQELFQNEYGKKLVEFGRLNEFTN